MLNNMKTKLKIMLGASIVSLSALSGVAQADSPLPTADHAKEGVETKTARTVGDHTRNDVDAEADNSKKNAKDRDDATVTPFDQGNSQADIDSTAAIRKGVVAMKDMSINAQNVKIITNEGRVSLRGPVKTIEEKAKIGELAIKVANGKTVSNELVITND